MIHRTVGGKLDRKQRNAAEPQMVGASVVSYATPYRYIDRNITPEIIADSYKIPIIFSSLSFHNRLCFGGLDFKLESIDGPEDDTKKSEIDQALKQIKKLDRNLARIGRNGSCTTLDCVRMASLEILSYRQAFFEKVIRQQEGNLYSPRLQHLPGQSFNKSPLAVVGQPSRYQIDGLLKGVIFDTQEVEAHFFQNVDNTREPVEVPPDQVLYIEDKGVPGNTSLLHSVMSTVEFMKQARHDFRLALARVGTPKEVAEVDGAVLAAMQNAGVTIEGGYKTLVDYCNNMVIGQANSQAEVALPGTRFRYPAIPIPIDPMAVEKFIEQIILNHIFAKAVTEQLTPAISISAAPGKALLDGVISGHQEVAGKPFVEMWQRDFLDTNGYDLVISFDYWSWTPKDQKAEADRATTVFAQGGSRINDYRAAMGLEAYSDEDLIKLFEEQNALKRGRIPGQEPMPGQVPGSPVPPGQVPGLSIPPAEEPGTGATEKPELFSTPGMDQKKTQSAFDKQLNYRCPENPPGSGNFTCDLRNDLKTAKKLPEWVNMQPPTSGKAKSSPAAKPPAKTAKPKEKPRPAETKPAQPPTKAAPQDRKFTKGQKVEFTIGSQRKTGVISAVGEHSCLVRVGKGGYKVSFQDMKVVSPSAAQPQKEAVKPVASKGGSKPYSELFTPGISKLSPAHEKAVSNISGALQTHGIKLNLLGISKTPSLIGAAGFCTQRINGTDASDIEMADFNLSIDQLVFDPGQYEGEQKAAKEAFKSEGKWPCVANTAKSHEEYIKQISDHEVGHALLAQYKFDMVKSGERKCTRTNFVKDRDWEKIAVKEWKKGWRSTRTGDSSTEELFAEAYCAHENGRDDLFPEPMIDYVEKVKTHLKGRKR